MSEPIPVTIPLINPNEPGAMLAALHVATGQRIDRGDIICTLETTKSTVELAAEGDGYLVGLAFSVGQTIQAGEVLGYLASDPNWVPPSPAKAASPRVQGLHISQAALSLVREHNVDLTSFSSDVFVTEKMVQELIEQSAHPEPVLLADSYHPEDILIYGGGGHGKSLIDLIRTLGTYSIAGIIDDSLQVGGSVMGVTVLGGVRILEQLRSRGLSLAANAVGGIGNINSRLNVFEHLARAGFACPSLVHSTAVVEPSASLADGVQVFPHAYVGSEAKIGFGVIINTGVVVSHDCNIGEYTNLSPGAILAGEVTVGRATLVGMGVTVNLRVKIGPRARIGNGATVKQDLPEGGLVHAGSIWPN
jgi:acetyltransferase EpsM